ncbi:NHL repeat-containing protein [Heyndrickxia sporothermodurans]|uniref:hypothetical protein n=2 Tax=Heyndrickxia sporothermodurans TaxID=46224 RepID=UPI0035DCF43D
MNKPISIKNIPFKLEKEIGIRKDKYNQRPYLKDPVIAQQLYETGEVFIFDPTNKDLPAFLVSKETKKITSLYSPSDTVLCGITFIKYIGNNTFLAILDDEIVQINDGDIVWKHSSKRENFKPITFDSWADGRIVVLDGANKELEVFYKDSINTKIWRIPEEYFIDPICIKTLENGNVLITDRELQLVFELSPNEKVVWQHGILGQPGSDVNQLTYPQSATVVTVK